VLVLDPQAQDLNSGRSRTGHASSLSTEDAQTMRENAVNTQICAMRAPLPLSGLQAGVSREELL
jgi:hypothetical protein